MTPAHRDLTERVAAVLEKQWPGGATPEDVTAVLAALAPELAVAEAAKASRDVLNTVFDTGHAAAEAVIAAEERLDQTVAVLGNEGEPEG